jgi:hypothetical protein
MKGDASLVWLLASLLAIAIVADHPLLGLAVAGAGGTLMGVLLVLGDVRRRARKQ